MCKKLYRGTKLQDKNMVPVLTDFNNNNNNNATLINNLYYVY